MSHPLLLKVNNPPIVAVECVSLVAILYAILIYLFSICLTKLDILDSFEEIKIGVAYKLDGKVLNSVPGQQNQQLR